MELKSDKEDTERPRVGAIDCTIPETATKTETASPPVLLTEPAMAPTGALVEIRT